MTFVGVGGQSSAGADFAGFVTRTGTDGFTQLVDATGEVYEQFGADDRSIFLFVNQDGMSEYMTWGVVEQSELSARVEQLINA